MSTHSDPPNLVSIQDAAAFFGVHPKTIRRRIDDGSITGYRIGPRQIRVNLTEAKAVLMNILVVPNE